MPRCLALAEIRACRLKGRGRGAGRDLQLTRAPFRSMARCVE
ncbi:MAG: hypothetical protein KGI32_02870 [Gammaproteobacteria bacterium]|nr:hypothetical protein [Gammaproteobacteria bacterium]